MDGQSYNTVELAQVRLTLRDDLEFSLQDYGGQTCYVVEDKTNSRYYRIGIPEYTLLSLLDGETTLSQAVAHVAETLGPNAFSEQDAGTICKWLIDTQLATTDDSIAIERLLDTSDKKKKQSRLKWLNPLILKVPLGNPQPILRAVGPWMSWLVSRPFVIIWLVVSVFALVQLNSNWYEFSLKTNGVFARDNWMWLAITFIFLKVFHELSHALACQHFGGTVRETGVVFVMFAPMPYVDVTSSWRFSSKWKRIAVSAAGMYVELLVAAIATLVWCNTDDPIVRYHAHNTIILAGITTVMFNANFLMRFDGYYILADLLEIPNLYSLGQQYLMYLGRRYFLGVSATPPRWPARRGTVIRIYGVATFLWRILVCVILVLAAAAMFAGAGIVLAIVTVILWLGVPLWRFGRYLTEGSSREKPSLVRLALTGGLTSMFIILAFAYAPWPFRSEAPAVVRHAPLMVVRAGSEGFVREILVEPGDTVAAGQILAVLENKQIETELNDLRMAIEQSSLRSRSHYREGNLAAYQAENHTRTALQSRADQRQKEKEQLVVRAPADGQLLNDDVASLLDLYVTVGTELFKIGDPARKELLISISQDDKERFELATGRHVDVRMTSGPRQPIEARLESINPRATQQVIDQALISTTGGPLPVYQASTGEDGLNTTWELLEPRFTATAELDEVHSTLFQPGQSVQIALRTFDRTVGQVVLTYLEKWLRKNTR